MKAAEAAEALAVWNLSYAFGKKIALDGVSFSIRPGQCVVLLGPNGAGKTTLFSLITRLYDSRGGRVAINGYDIKRQTSKALEQIGVVFQQPTLDMDLSVLQNLRYFASLQGMSRKHMKTRIEEELRRQEMYERRGEKIRQLNSGHRRRVEIARALLHNPTMLLLDEPTVGLDVPSRRTIVEYVHALCKSRRIAVLWATHLIDEIFADDRVIVLHRGRIRATGGVAEIQQAAAADSIDAAFHNLTRDTR